MKKKLIVSVTAFIMTVTLAIGVNAIYAGSLYFDDANDDMAYDNIDAVYEDGYMFGVSEGIFAPDNNVTFAELVTVMYRLAGTPKVEEVSGSADKWYHTEMTWGKSIGLIDHAEDLPEEIVTREDTVKMLYNVAILMEADISAAEDLSVLDWFHDSNDISPDATEAWCYVIKNKIILGDGWAHLMVNDTLTREQLSYIIARSSYRIGVNLRNSELWNIPKGETEITEQPEDSAVTVFSVDRISNRYLIENEKGEYICTTSEDSPTDTNIWGNCPYVYGTISCYGGVYINGIPFPEFTFSIPDSNKLTVTPLYQGVVEFSFKGLRIEGYGIEKITYEGNTVTVYGRRAAIRKSNVDKTDYTIVFADN